MRHHCRWTWKAAEPAARDGGAPSFRDRAPSRAGEEGDPVLGCSAKRTGQSWKKERRLPPKRHKPEGEASAAPLISRGWRQPRSHRHCEGPGRHTAPGTGLAAGLHTTSHPLLVRHHLLSTNYTVFGKAGISKEHFFKKKKFIFINCKEGQVSNNSTGFPGICQQHLPPPAAVEDPRGLFHTVLISMAMKMTQEEGWSTTATVLSVTEQHTPLATVSETPQVQWGNEVEEAPAPDVKDKIKSLPRERQMIYTRHFT